MSKFAHVSALLLSSLLPYVLGLHNQLSRLFVLLLAILLIGGGCGGTEIGALPTHFHGVSGTLYVESDDRFCIDLFNYDGRGPG